MADLNEMRIVLLGRTGYGKSSSGNTILGDSSSTKFLAKCSPSSVTRKCEAQRGPRAGKETQIKIIDTPGLFDTCMHDEELKPEIVKCITTCAPGPHAFIIVLSVGRYTEQETATMAKITKSFGECAFKYSVVLFTHGNDLDKGLTIEQFVEKSKELKELVEKCGGRCHVIDNKYWNPEKDDKNRVQVDNLLNTIDEMVKQNGGCYTNEMLKVVEKGIQKTEGEIRKENPNEKSAIWIRAEAINRYVKKLLVKWASMTAGALVGALTGIETVARVAFILRGTAGEPQSSTLTKITAMKMVQTLGGMIEGPVSANTGLCIGAATGAMGGALVGLQAVEDGDGVCEGVKKAVRANLKNAEYIPKVKEICSEVKEVLETTKDLLLN